MMDIEGVEEYREAGRIASAVRKMIPELVRPGKRILDVCEEVEAKTRELGGLPAFPCNVCVNEVAAHYTSSPSDESKIPEGGLVKVDIGVSVEGYIADTALTLALDESYAPMVSASMKGLEAALSFLRPGVSLRDVGARIEQAIENYGFKPIRNLTGHKMERFVLHAGKSVPNVASGVGLKALEGEVYAIEPFVTTLDGAGNVVEGHEVYIYRYVKDKGLKEERDRLLIRLIRENYKTMPFALRWINRLGDRQELLNRFPSLVERGCVTGYPVLIEEFGKPVAQSEHTVLVTGRGCVVLTA
jgi:methionyl aminopeptidase